MQRIDTATRAIDLWGPGKDGFTRGDPAAGIATTQLNEVAFNNYQEEICNAIELSNIVLNPADMTQLWQAIRAQVIIVGDGRWVRITGDVMTGDLTLPNLTAGGQIFANGAVIGIGGQMNFSSDLATANNLQMGTSYFWSWGYAGTLSWITPNGAVLGIDPAGNLNTIGGIAATGNISTPASIFGGYFNSSGNIDAAGALSGTGLGITGNAVVTGNTNSGSVTTPNINFPGSINAFPGGGGNFQVNADAHVTGSLGADRNLHTGDGSLGAGTGILFADNLQISDNVPGGRVNLIAGSLAVNNNLTGRYILSYGTVNAAGDPFFGFMNQPDNRSIWFGALERSLYWSADGNFDFLLHSGPAGVMRWHSDGMNGNFTAFGQLIPGSDARTKNILGNYTRGLAEVIQLNPKSYTAINDPRELVQYGLVAQQVQEALPECVMLMPRNTCSPTQLPEGMLGLSIMGLIATLINACKEIAARLDALEAEGRHPGRLFPPRTGGLHA